MIQERKKDYLQRLIENFFKKFADLLNSEGKLEPETRKKLLNDGFRFFFDNFDILSDDNEVDLAKKVGDYDLLEQYARLLMLKHEMTDFKNQKDLKLALSIVEYIQKVDSTYSWDRTILREDLLRLIDGASSKNDM